LPLTRLGAARLRVGEFWRDRGESCRANEDFGGGCWSLSLGRSRGGDRSPDGGQTRGIGRRNGRRREFTLSAPGGNWWLGQTRCRSQGSARGTLFVTNLSLAKSVSACSDESCRVRVPLGGFDSERVTNSNRRANHSCRPLCREAQLVECVGQLRGPAFVGAGTRPGSAHDCSYRQRTTGERSLQTCAARCGRGWGKPSRASVKV
jgi:hypothetical protein